MREAEEALQNHVGAIMALSPQTLEGVVIQAQALIAWRAAGKIGLFPNEQTVDWPGRLAASILDQCKSQGATT